MPKREMLDIEKETEEMINSGNFDKHYKFIILHVDSMMKDILRFNKGSSIATMRLSVKLSKLEAYARDSRRIILKVKKHREFLRRIKNAKKSKIN